MKAYRNYKKIALGTESKIQVLQDLLIRHKHDKVLIFTAENEMVYRISNDYLIPAITHETTSKNENSGSTHLIKATFWRWRPRKF